MSNNITLGSGVLSAPAFAVLLAALGLFGCNSASASENPTPAPCATPVGGAIKLSVVPSRVSGVAPLAVFFDATGTTTGATKRPFHELEYRWDFGDPASGATWRAGSRPGLSSRNSATGPVAAHLFETPGTYSVTLTVNAAKASCVITVQDPEVEFAGAKTICFSTSGDFTGCPEGADRFKSADFGAVSNATSGYSRIRRILLRRGETWAATKTAVLRASGPGILGAFGQGAPPVVRSTGNNAILQFSDRTTPKFGDWRMMDLELDGQKGVTSAGVTAGGGAIQVTLLRMSIRDTHAGVVTSSHLLDHMNATQTASHHAIWDQLAIVDSTVSRTGGGAGGNGVYVSAQRFSLIGSVIDDTTSSEHVLRTPYIGKGVISNNTLSKPASGKHVVKMHAPIYSSAGVVGGGRFTEQVVLSDNDFVGAAGADWSVTIGPQDNINDERVRDVIIERNLFRAGPGTQAALVVWAAEVTVRNNICDTTGGRAHACFFAGQRGIEPASTHVRLQNNTCYSADARPFHCVVLGARASNITVQNNLASAPRSINPRMILDQGASGVIASHNTTDSQILSNAPGWVAATPTVPAHFRLKTGSPYIDAGLAIPVFSDFFQTSRPRGARFDMGAVEN